MSSTASLESFLGSAKWQLKNAITDKQRITLVMGDQRADLDSIVSAILFAFVRTVNTPSNAWTKTYIPLMNASRKEVGDQALLLRLLSDIGLDQSHLIAVEDLVAHGSVKSGLNADSTRFFLLGHNKMVGRSDQDLSKKVLGCIDNHNDEKYVPMGTDPEPRIIGRAGSCTSLVVNWASKEWSTESAQSETHLAKFALAPILVGTQNLSNDASTSDEDRQAVKFLEEKILASSESTGKFDRSGFYKYLIGEDEAASIVATATEGTAVNETIAKESGKTDLASVENSAGEETSVGTTTETTGLESNRLEAPAEGGQSSTEGVTETAEAAAETGGITGAVSAVYNYLTGGGNKTSEVEESAATTTTDAEISSEPRALGTSHDTSAAEIGASESADTELTAGSTELAYRTKEEPATTTGGAGSLKAAGSMTTTADAIASRMPWLADTTSTITYASTTTSTTSSTTNLVSVLNKDYSQLESSSGSNTLIGISCTPYSLSQLVSLAEYDLVNSAIHQSSSTDEVMSGTPFTAAVRKFATSQNISLYVIATASHSSSASQDVTRELFLWQFDSKLGSVIPNFETHYGSQLGLQPLDNEDQDIVKEPGMEDGMMRAFKHTKGEVTSEELTKMITKTLSS